MVVLKDSKSSGVKQSIQPDLNMVDLELSIASRGLHQLSECASLSWSCRGSHFYVVLCILNNSFHQVCIFGKTIQCALLVIHCTCKQLTQLQSSKIHGNCLPAVLKTMCFHTLVLCTVSLFAHLVPASRDATDYTCSTYLVKVSSVVQNVVYRL